MTADRIWYPISFPRLPTAIGMKDRGSTCLNLQLLRQALHCNPNKWCLTECTSSDHCCSAQFCALLDIVAFLLWRSFRDHFQLYPRLYWWCHSSLFSSYLTSCALLNIRSTYCSSDAKRASGSVCYLEVKCPHLAKPTKLPMYVSSNVIILILHFLSSSPLAFSPWCFLFFPFCPSPAVWPPHEI